MANGLNMNKLKNPTKPSGFLGVRLGNKKCFCYNTATKRIKNCFKD